jgi:hypothetical protein
MGWGRLLMVGIAICGVFVPIPRVHMSPNKKDARNLATDDPVRAEERRRGMM